MEYKDLMSLTNAIIIALVEGAYKMGIDTKLLFHRMSASLQKDAVKLLNDIITQGKGYEANLLGKDMKGTVESYLQIVTDMGLANKTEILEFTDDTLKVRVDFCIFQQASRSIIKVMTEDGLDPVNDSPPPCEVMALLAGMVLRNTGKQLQLKKIERLEDENASIITMAIEN